MRPRIAQRRRRSGGDGSGVAFAGTLLLHVVAGSGVFLAPRPTMVDFPLVYQVDLVAAPRLRPERRPEAVRRPAESAVPISRRSPRRTSVADETPPPVAARQREFPVQTTTDVVARDEPSTGRDVATVRTSGVSFPYPAYLNNIVVQVYRRWRRPTANAALRAEILFFIRADGSVTNLQFTARSGNFAFDLEAQGAVEAAANSGAFGPLPGGYPADVLPVSFFFDPASLR